ncbi:hypothetical protein SO802_007859 [Lithocarpus litseifolius]|uniref:Pentatricopeptide repeat-containing protein n=1 Tax=Lithocarpus litseifolius TaxID=425828 RepID=A0AAW2DUW6_9ROSI
MSKLNLWFCVLRSFNVIAGAFALVFQLNEWSRRVQISPFVGLKARTSVASVLTLKSELIFPPFLSSRQLNSALKVFDEMPLCDVVTYNLLISGRARCGFPIQALYLYAEMVQEGRRESPSTFSTVFGFCSDAGFYGEGIQVHCRVITLGFGLNLFVGSSLVDLYMHMGHDDVAFKLFNELPE